MFTYYGLDAINGRYELGLLANCGLFYQKLFDINWEGDDGTSGSATLVLQIDYLASFPWTVFVLEFDFVPGNFPPFLNSQEVLGGSFFGYQAGSGTFIECRDRCTRTEQDPCIGVHGLDYLGEGTLMRFQGPDGSLETNFFGEPGLNDELVTTRYWPLYYAGARRQITGWQYVISDIPEFVDVRAFGTTVYRVQGLDAYNGTYDVARDENLDCAAGLQQFQLNLTAEQYDITTSTPCLETPIPGGTKDVLATLTIPPRQSNKAILNLVIDGVGTFSYTLSEDWDSYACGPQTETLTESDPCLTHTGDWLTIESSALF